MTTAGGKSEVFCNKMEAEPRGSASCCGNDRFFLESAIYCRGILAETAYFPFRAFRLGEVKAASQAATTTKAPTP